MTLESKQVALWNRVELDGVDAELSDDFVRLRPGMAETILTRPARTLTLFAVKKKLMTRSLADLSR